MSKLMLKRQSKRRGRKPSLHIGRLQWDSKWLSPEWYARKLTPSWQACIPLALLIALGWGYAVVAAEPPKLEDVATMVKDMKVGMDTMWVMIAGMMVFFMNAGFCMLETGMCRQKNAVNVLAKNLIVFALSTIAFWAIGFSLMFSTSNGFIGSGAGFFLMGADNSPATADAYEGIFGSLNWTGIPLNAKFFFQLVFAGTAATIVSGAVAERIKFVSFLIFSLLLVGIAYPITGHWIWGGGWLYTLSDATGKALPGFWDFAGSTVVHAVGGWAALAGAFFLGPRIGKYNADGSGNAMPAHNMSIATLGCLILWLGWFGFNPGSTMAADPVAISHIALTTNTAGAFGCIAGTLTAWFLFGKPDLSMVINGLLAGLVAVTAPCAYISVPSAAVVGAIGGVAVVFAVGFFDKLKIDDPVGAISVHLVNGVWGTLAVGLFAEGDKFYKGGPVGLFFGGGIGQLATQFIGSVAVGAMILVVSSIFWLALKSTLGIRVTEEEELIGLDIGEHGMEAYAGFVKDASGAPSSAGISSGVASPY